MEFVIGLLWFIALATVMVFGIWRIEVNTRRIEENTALLVRVEELFGKEFPANRDAMPPPKPQFEVVSATRAPIEDAEITRIPRRPQCDTLVEGSEPPLPRDTTPNAQMHVSSLDEELDDDDEHRPTTVLPRCGKCGSVNYQPVGGLFKCSACGKIGHLTFPGLERKVA